jgi:hypothetical protein
MKKIIPILIVGIFFLSGFGASATSVVNIIESIEWEQIEISAKSQSDDLDQYQLDMDFFAPVGPIFLAPEINYISAQSFIPTKNTLTRVEILVGKNSTTTFDLTLAIRDDLCACDITSLSLPAGDIVTEDFGRTEFDIDDITVIPGNTYFIVCSTNNETDNWYAWGAKLTDVYPNGTVWFSLDDGTSFTEDSSADLAFATYGFDNLPPSAPTITGPNSGKPNTEYDFYFNATDPDGDPIMYIIEWGDNTTEPTEYGDSGEEIILKHSWAEEGNYTIRAKTRDINGAESAWETLEINIPRNRAKIYNFKLLGCFFERFQNAFPLLQYLLRF